PLQFVLLAECLLEARDHVAAMPLLEEATAAVDSVEQPGNAAYAMALMARGLLQQGRLSEAVARAARPPMPDTLGEVIRRSVLATARARRGDPDPGVSLEDDDLRASCSDLNYGWWVASAQAEMAVLRGDPRVVGRDTESALSWASDTRHAWAAGELRYW